MRPRLRLTLVMPMQFDLLDGFATGLISLANFVVAAVPDVEVDIFDFSATPASSLDAEIRFRLRGIDGPHVVGITTTTAGYQSALTTARAFKRCIPDCTVIFGGHHASADSDVILSSHPDVVDYVIRGEGERSLASFVSTFPSVGETPGLAFRRHGAYVENPAPPFLTPEELDAIGITFRGAMLRRPGKFGHVSYVSARGCPLKCAFCSVANERIRARNVARVVDDVRELTRMAYWKIAIEDNFFAHSAARTRELCTALAHLREREGLDFNWDCQTRVEAVAKRETVGLLAKAGCEAAYLGVESLNVDQLIYLNKAADPVRYLAQLTDVAVPRLLDSSVDCYINLQFGLPGENDHHADATLDVIRRLGRMAFDRGRTITIFPMLHVVYPGTRHFADGVASGRFDRRVFESFTEWEDDQSPVRAWLGAHFAHGTGGLPEGILVADKLAHGEFELDMNAVLKVSTTIDKLEGLGVEVFHYGEHLVGAGPE